MAQATLPGIYAARAVPGNASGNTEFETDIIRLAHSEMPTQVDVLALSGGGDYGAFGAGVLVGWTHAGTRPEFKIVTGISTGAILATFAFLGPEYDENVRQAYTTIDAGNVYRGRTLSVLWSDALTDSTPLAELIARFVDDKTIAAVARAYRAGRRLYVGTTNLDTDRLVVWNMGAIADANRPQLFRQVLLASASIPGIFPPVLIDVEANGHHYDEMHVDGGVKAQMFLLSTMLDVDRLRSRLAPELGHAIQVNIYAIRNAKTDAEPKPVQRRLTEISSRALSSMLRTQGVNDLRRAYQRAHENGFAFNWMSIPAAYSSQATSEFDRAEMQRLFEIGYRLGSQGNAWQREPPESAR